MRLILLLILILIPFGANSQDLITLRNGVEIECEITRVDCTTIFYNFNRGNKTLSTFIDKSNIRSYKIGVTNDFAEDTTRNTIHKESKTVVIDSSQYVGVTQDWVNLISYSQRYGEKATGWSLQYYGYILRNNSKWIIPMMAGFEKFDLDKDYFSQFQYQSMHLGYMMAGISPLYKLDDYFFLNLGLQLLIGEEKLTDFFGQEKSTSIFGLAPSQGLYFMSKSEVGIVVGLSAYEKILNSEVYKSDIGVKLDIGIKF